MHCFQLGIPNRKEARNTGRKRSESPSCTQMYSRATLAPSLQRSYNHPLLFPGHCLFYPLPLKLGKSLTDGTGEAMTAVLGIPPYPRTHLLSYTNAHMWSQTRPAVSHSGISWPAGTADSLPWKQLLAHVESLVPEEDAELASHSHPA